ncbi:hypothetical protein C1N81_42405 [Streptomyces sp. SGAir0957]
MARHTYVWRGIRVAVAPPEPEPEPEPESEPDRDPEPDRSRTGPGPGPGLEAVRSPRANAPARPHQSPHGGRPGWER